MSYIATLLGFITANYLYQFFKGKDYKFAFTVSYFQAAILLAHALFS